MYAADLLSPLSNDRTSIYSGVFTDALKLRGAFHLFLN